jgi:hypothetical protein
MPAKAAQSSEGAMILGDDHYRLVRRYFAVLAIRRRQYIQRGRENLAIIPLLVALLLAGAPASFANPQGYLPIQDDPVALNGTAAQAINNASQIVGAAIVNPSGPPPVHSFFLPNGGAYQDFDVTATAISSAFGINNKGQIVGGYEEPITVGKAYSGTAGAPLPLVPPGSAEATAAGINDAGVIVGSYDTTFHGASHSFIWSPPMIQHRSRHSTYPEPVAPP